MCEQAFDEEARTIVTDMIGDYETDSEDNYEYVERSLPVPALRLV